MPSPHLVFPKVLFQCKMPVSLCSVSNYLPIMASVVKIACQTPRQGVQKCTEEQPGDMKLEHCFNPLPFAEGPSNEKYTSPCQHPSISAEYTDKSPSPEERE